MKRILLDTNAYVRFLSGDQNVLNVLARTDIVYMSIFVLGELYAGFKGGKKELENKNLLEKFLRKPTINILNASIETAEVFGEMKNALKVAGTPLPINDVWIAAHSLENGAVLVTYDRHFKKIAGLRLWDYLS